MPGEPNGAPKRVERYRDNRLVHLDAIVFRLNDDCDYPVGIEETQIERLDDLDYIQYKSDVQEESYRILWFSDSWKIDRAFADISPHGILIRYGIHSIFKMREIIPG